MHSQLLNLYTLEEHLKHTQHSHISIYITPSGKIFDCRQKGVISHCEFTKEFYNNYSNLIKAHPDIDFDTEVSEFILYDKDFTLKDIRDFYLDQFYDIQYEDVELYNLIKNNYLAQDNLLVQDLGFVKVSINRAEMPAIMLPMSIFNGKRITPEQYNTLINVLNYNTISTQDFISSRLIKMRERELKLKNMQILELATQYTK